jgi:hypothetical protein
MKELVKNSRIGIGILIGVGLGVLIGGQELDGAVAAGICIGVIAIIVENMILRKK